MFVPRGAVLQAAKFRAGHFLHDPFDPAFDHRQVGPVARFTVDARQCQHWRDGIHIEVRRFRPVQLVVEPAAQVIQYGVVAGLLPGLVDAVQRHPGGPFPSIHGQVAFGRIVPIRMTQHVQHLVRNLFIFHSHIPPVS